VSNTSLTIKDMCDTVGVKDVTVRAWMRDGMPCTKEKLAGKSKVVFDRALAIGWLLSNGKTDYASSLAPPIDTGVELGESDTDCMGLASMVDRLKNTELYCYAQFKAYTEKGEGSGGMTQQWMEYWKDMCEQRRKVEKDRAGILLANGSVILKAKADQEQREMATAIRGQLLALPNALAPLCEGKDAVGISEVLRDGVTDCLRHLADGGE
jgi:hypothetical protein